MNDRQSADMAFTRAVGEKATHRSVARAAARKAMTPQQIQKVEARAEAVEEDAQLRG